MMYLLGAVGLVFAIWYGRLLWAICQDSFAEQPGISSWEAIHAARCAITDAHDIVIAALHGICSLGSVGLRGARALASLRHKSRTKSGTVLRGIWYKATHIQVSNDNLVLVAIRTPVARRRARALSQVAGE